MHYMYAGDSKVNLSVLTEGQVLLTRPEFWVNFESKMALLDLLDID